MLKSYGGYTWTSQDPHENNPEGRRGLGLTAMAIMGGAGAYGATRTMSSGYRPVDYIAGAARLGGNLAPFQLGNTFRIPEILSPWLSNKYRGEGIDNFGVWDKEFLKSDSTYDWLKYSTNLNDAELRARGINRGMLGPDAAESIRWSPTTGSKGRLEAVLPGGKTHTLSHDIQLLATNEETINVFTDKRGLNKYAAGVMAAGDMHRIPGFKEEDVFARAARVVNGETVVQRASSPFIPMPALHGEVNGFADVLRRTAGLRGVAAFEMGRFNVLLGNVVDQFGGDLGKKFFNDVLKIGPGVKPGPASHMFARYGMLAAGAGALIMGNEQLDWMRRQGGLPGHAVSSAAVAAGASYLTSRMGGSSRAAFMTGLGAFMGQMALPGFNQGLMQGLATTGVNADIIRANAFNPINYYRRTLEGFVPGISDWKTGALLSLGAVTAAGLTLPGMRERINVKVARGFGKHLPIIGDSLQREIGMQNRSIRDMFYENVGRELGYAPEDTYGFLRRKSLLGQYHVQGDDPLSRTRSLNRLWSQSEEEFSTMRKANPLNTRLVEHLRSIAKNHQGGGLNGLLREAKGFTAEAYMNFFGADLGRDRALMQEVRDLGFGARGPTGRLGRLGAVGLAAFVGHGLLTGGLLGSMETSDQLRNIYSGKQLVEMKKSRWWEGGGTPFEGGETSYFRPHAYALMMNRVREKSVWGDKDDTYSPIRKFFIKNFTYDLEKETYWSRPYPMSNAAFSDIPIIGGVLAGSIGQIIKPPKLMHTGEWMREGPDGQTEFANVFRGGFVEPAYSLGATGPGKPTSPFANNVLHSNLVHQFRELEGMTGWAKSVVSKVAFGSEHWASDQARLATSGEMTSWANNFWAAELGGAFFSNEFVRRIFPRKQAEIKQYNPLLNNMPSWMPDKYHYGDPYKSVQWGETRLPGAGFAAMHPELAGVDPEAYPLLYKYQILSDLAPLTPEFFKAQQALYTQRQAGAFTAREIDWIDRVDANRSKVVNRLSYRDAPEGAITLPGSGISRSVVAAGGEFMRTVAAPAEYLVPMGFRPFQKLTGGQRGPIERYEYERLYGTPLAFWDEPVRDWLRPSFYSALHALGYDGKPVWRKEADATNEYFDKLEFIKYMGLADQASAAGDGQGAAQYRWQASQTRVGVNPQGSPLSIYWSLPAEERPYFNSFMQTTNDSERERILEMVPADQGQLYKSLWSRIDSGDPTLYGTSTMIDQAYMQNKLGQTNQEMSTYPMPREDWIGWHQDVDMSDVKVRYVDRIGSDLHDYGLWESDLRKSNGQPFLEGSEDFAFTDGSLRFSNMRSEVYNMLGSSTNAPKLSWAVMPGTNPYSHITFNDNRDGDVQQALGRYMNNGY